MKKILLIWVGVIVLLIVGGIVYGQLTKEKEQTGPEQTEITYKDDKGNDIKEKVDDEQVSITIGKETFTYNSGIWKGKPIKIGEDTLETPLYVENLTEKGYEEYKNSCFKKDENHSIYSQYNAYYGYLFSISLYDEPFNTANNTSMSYCKDVVLPANVKLGESTREYVESIYGVSKDYVAEKGNLITVKYYANEDKKGERLSLMYTKDTEILVGIEWSFDVTQLN